MESPVTYVNELCIAVMGGGCDKWIYSCDIKDTCIYDIKETCIHIWHKRDVYTYQYVPADPFLTCEEWVICISRVVTASREPRGVNESSECHVYMSCWVRVIYVFITHTAITGGMAPKAVNCGWFRWLRWVCEIYMTVWVRVVYSLIIPHSAIPGGMAYEAMKCASSRRLIEFVVTSIWLVEFVSSCHLLIHHTAQRHHWRHGVRGYELRGLPQTAHDSHSQW